MLTRRVAIVTGAARNIGRGIAAGLLEDRYECVLLDNDQTALAKTTKELRQIGPCHEYVADVGDIPQLKEFMRWLGSKALLEDVRVLVNNAGYESPLPFLALDAAEVYKSNAVNLAGPVWLAKAVAGAMLEHPTAPPQQRGNIIFITSTHDHLVRGHPLYSASKAAQTMFMREAAIALAPNIRVNAIAPGPVKDTPRLEPNTAVPLGFTLQPEDIAGAVQYILSARFMTGQTLVIDGGFELNGYHALREQGLLQ